WALASALAGIGPLDRRLDESAALRRSHVRLYQGLTALFTPAYQSDSVWPALLRDILLAPLSRVSPGPGIRQPLSRESSAPRLKPWGWRCRTSPRSGAERDRRRAAIAALPIARHADDLTGPAGVGEDEVA